MTNKKRRQKFANYDEWLMRDYRMFVVYRDWPRDNLVRDPSDPDGEPAYDLLRTFRKATRVSLLQAEINDLAAEISAADRRLLRRYANKFGDLPRLNLDPRWADLNWRDRVR